MDDALRIALEAGLPYTSLRDFELDRKLLHYVPLAYALQERVLPLLVVGDTLKLASARADPDLRQLRTHFPYVTVDIVVAPADEIDLVLERAQSSQS